MLHPRPCPKLTRSKRMQAVYADIWAYLEDLGPDEVRRYMRAFPNEPDYNLAQHGNLRVYTEDIRDMFARCGWEYVKDTYTRAWLNNARGDYKITADHIWDMYRVHVGLVARAYV